MENEIINKVANSGLITIDLEEFYPKGERFLFDIKPLLFHELITMNVVPRMITR